jgi:hypothetical protein
LRTDVFIVYQHVVNNDEAARTASDDLDAANDCYLSVALGIFTPSVSHELELFPERYKSSPECVQLQQWRFSDETVSAMGRGGCVLRHQHPNLSISFLNTGNTMEGTGYVGSFYRAEFKF